MRTLVAVLVAGLVALSAPAAFADHVDADCRFNAVSHAALTGADRWEGHAQGWAYAKHDTVTVRCVVYVDGVEAATTAPGDPTPSVAVTAGRISFTRSLTDVTLLCPVVTTRHGEQHLCRYQSPTQLPPQEVTDPLNWTLRRIDRTACLALAALSPGTPPAYIDPEGDVYVNGEQQCPPYST